MLGTRIADGFAAYLRFPNQYDLRINVFAKTPPTATPPAGINFRTCTGANWQYFTVQGFTQDERFTNVINTAYYRVAYFGSETNPDSLILESQVFGGGNSTIFKSTSKSLNCSPCVTNDNTPPVFNCPTTTVTYSQPFSPTDLRIYHIIGSGFNTAGTNVQATDNCNTPMIGFQYLNDVYWGGVYPISLVAYDSAGNKSACNFNLKIPCSPSVFGPNFSNCPTNISLQAAAGQTCVAATWTAPRASNGGSPVRVSSNFASGACLPIGTTAVIYTARDSCGFSATCTFNVTVTGGTTGGGNYCASKGTAPWELWVSSVKFGTIDNTSDKFKDFNTLGYSDYTNVSTSVSKGQTYFLRIGTGLSWSGNLSNVYGRVWIDFNNNKIFEDTELVLTNNALGTLITNVLIPQSAVTGSIRMRVAAKFGIFPQACENFEKGEVEDYTVNIQSGTNTCVVTNCPPNITVNTTTNSAVASWITPTLSGTCGGLVLLASVPPSTTVVNSGSSFPVGVSNIRYDVFNTSDGTLKDSSCRFSVTVVNTGGTSDIALTITSTPSVYRPYTLQNFRITATNSGTTVFSNVKIKFTRPALTAGGGTKVASIGTFQDYCPGGIECSEWTIPTLAAGVTATLDVPVFVLNPTGGITASANLISSNPVDNSTGNNAASVTVNSANAPITQPLVVYKPTQLIPIVIQKLNPTLTEGEITLELESLIEKTIDFGISNSMGQQVMLQQIAVERGINKVGLDVSQLPQGLYFIQTNVGHGRNVPTKFIKL